MTIRDELAAAMDELIKSDPATELERCGLFDHEGLRQFATEYSDAIIGVIMDEKRFRPSQIAEHLSASVLAGFLLGLDYERRRRGEE